jgi:peptide/nickel transport system ATP-binding protein
MTGDLITIDGLSVHYPLKAPLFGKPPILRAVEGVSLEIPKGSFFGLVGESGSGKTTLGRAILKAAPISEGRIRYDDGTDRFDVGLMTAKQTKAYRRHAQLIFQDPYAALSPA